tara:strand:- start:2212 stop:2892 length:681 start_codon:yes stop_codon:yes gene_type:complete
MKKGLVVIPARLGSKGLPNKNKIKILGKELVLYTIEAARKCFSDSEICFSTDDKELKKIVEKNGLNVPFLRSKKIAKDDTPTKDVVLDAINFYSKNFYLPDYVCLLQPTSPLRNEIHLKESLNLFFKYNPDVLVSVTKSKTNPYILFTEKNKNNLMKLVKSNYYRRQDIPNIFKLNGAIYIYNKPFYFNQNLDETNNIIKYEMDKKFSIDIDNKKDLENAIKIINN